MAGVGRGYTWGPAIPAASTITSEPYNGGSRIVQYFDKARMELSAPNFNAGDLNYVTTGNLVRELVSGQRQDGDNTFTALTPSTIQVAGDPNTNGQNAIAPTYANFKNVATLSGSENGVAAVQLVVVQI